MIKLRDYQTKFKAGVMEAWADGYRSVLGVLPTGGGKTVTFASIVSEHVGAAIIIVHRREILSQISQSVAMVSEDLAGQGRMHRVVAPAKTIAMIRRKHLERFGKCFIDPQAQVGVASVQTLTSPATGKDQRLQAWFKQVTLAVFDEGHHYVEAGFWARAVHLFDRAKLLFVTATPERADGTGLGKGEGGFADIMIEGPTPKELIDRGHLCKYKYFCPDTGFDVGDVPLTAKGEFNADAMRAQVLESHLVGKLTDQYQKFASGTKAIGFVESIITANELALEFNARGIKAVALSSKTEEGERERALHAFEHGDVMVLLNVDLFDEGFDVPAAVTCLIGRATMSLAKYMQMVGRVLRTAEGKEFAIVIDAVGNWQRHGQVTWPRVWTLSGREKGDRENSDKPPQRVCNTCSQPYEAFRMECPYCEAPFEPTERKSPEQVDGDLTLLDLDALDALFEARAKANMEDDEFERGQIARNVPPIGRGAEVKRFRATKYRRDVLHNIIGWWVGMQPEGRALAETQKRFFLRFKVDMITASTLDLKATDELIEKIAKGFDKDLANG